MAVHVSLWRPVIRAVLHPPWVLAKGAQRPHRVVVTEQLGARTSRALIADEARRTGSTRNPTPCVKQ